MKLLLPQALQLQDTFQRIQQTRMRGLPFLNPALQVQAIGFHPHSTGILGVLVTPWFMNLMLLPDEKPWERLQVGEKTHHFFPSGEYEFIVGEEAGLGQYQMCSLFSPMQDFVDQAAAVATAEAILVALMDEQNIEALNQYQRWDSTETPAPATPGLSRRALIPGLGGGR